MSALAAAAPEVAPEIAAAAPAAYKPSVVLPDSHELPRKLWTRDDMRRLLDAGFLDADRHYELIEGEIIEKTSQGRKHILIIMQLIKVLAEVFGFDFIQSQSTLPINPVNEPEPDTAVLDKHLSEYVDIEPGPENVRLMVEVSVSTLNTDRRVKGMIYARAGIGEYWIVNVNARKLEVYRQPTPDGYALTMILNEDETVRPFAKPNAEVAVKDLLP